MNNIQILAIISLSAAAGIAGACTPASDTTTTANANRATTSTANTTAGNNTAAPPKTEDEIPAAVKAAMPDAQSFTAMHKDIPKDTILDIERDTGAKVPDTDHHSYSAFSATSGARKQIGAATAVKANGKDVVIVYENKNNSPAIKEVRSEGVSADFLKQFTGKGHDDKFAVGGDIKANGIDDATAKAIAQAVRIDSLTMQSLYGASHTH